MWAACCCSGPPLIAEDHPRIAEPTITGKASRERSREVADRAGDAGAKVDARLASVSEELVEDAFRGFVVQGNAHDPPEAGDWSCATCGEGNEHFRSHCYVCRTLGPAAESPALEADVAPPASVSRSPWSRSYEVADLVAAGVPEDAADGVAQLARAVDARGREPLSDPVTLLRFLRAREFDTLEAEKMYRESKEWRSSYSIRATMQTFGSGEAYNEDSSRMGKDPTTWGWQWQSGHAATPEAALLHRVGFWGRLEKLAPVDGAPIAVWRLGVVDAPGWQRENLVALLKTGFIAHLEDCLQASRAETLRQRKLVRVRLVLDATGLHAMMLRYMSTFREITAVGKMHFPEVFASFTIVNAPSVVTTFFNVVSSSMTPLMRKKVCILGTDFEEGLRNHAGLERMNLPKFLGGEASDGEVCAAGRVPLKALAQVKGGG